MEEGCGHPCMAVLPPAVGRRRPSASLHSAPPLSSPAWTAPLPAPKWAPPPRLKAAPANPEAAVEAELLRLGAAPEEPGEVLDEPGAADHAGGRR